MSELDSVGPPNKGKVVMQWDRPWPVGVCVIIC